MGRSRTRCALLELEQAGALSRFFNAGGSGPTTVKLDERNQLKIT